jgi:tagatose-6-phosphate ketose/aldose isomerase
MFGYTEEDLRRLGAEHTAREIAQQPEVWLKTLALIERRADEIKDFLARSITPDTRVILTGAGTSSYTGDVARYGVAAALPCRVESIPTTSLVASPQYYLEPETPTVLVSFGRSGNSPESAGAFDLVQEHTKHVTHLVVTCASDGALAQRAQSTPGSFLLLLPDEVNDRGFAMTSSFTCMHLSALLFFDIGRLAENRAIVETLAAQGRRVLEEDWAGVKALADARPERLVYLGSGPLAELGKELALKNMELSNGRIVSVSESTMGFRHGPKTIVNDKTLIVVLGSESAYTRAYVRDITAELHGDPGAHRVAGVAYAPDPELAAHTDRYFCVEGAPVPEYYACLNYVLYGQLMGLFNSLAIGNLPDSPNPSGVVNRVVKGVTIYPYEGEEKR